MSTFNVGDIGLIVTANKLGDDRQGYFIYTGSNEGYHCKHFIFKSCNGKYLITYTDIDFRCGDVTFTKEGTPFKKSMRNKRFTAIKGSNVPQFLFKPGRLYGKTGV